MDAFSAAKQQQAYRGLCCTLYPNHIDSLYYGRPWELVSEIYFNKDTMPVILQAYMMP